jgi:hypothetical protein
MIEIMSRSEDDPPIFALRVVSDEPFRELGAWLHDRSEVERVVLDLSAGADLGSDEVDELAARHQVRIKVIAEGTGEPAPA